MKLVQLATAFLLAVAGFGSAQAQSNEDFLTIQLKDGPVVIQLMPDVAPKHVAQIKDLASKEDVGHVSAVLRLMWGLGCLEADRDDIEEKTSRHDGARCASERLGDLRDGCTGLERGDQTGVLLIAPGLAAARGAVFGVRDQADRAISKA